MKYNIKILFFILFILRVINNSSKFSIQLVDENMRNGTYIRPTISEDGYLYILSLEKIDIQMVLNLVGLLYHIILNQQLSIHNIFLIQIPMDFGEVNHM